jgi:energy-converting hydrogenase B subunit D
MGTEARGGAGGGGALIVVQYASLLLVALGGAAVVLTRDPARQAVVAGIFGVSLTILFFVFQAPDVALSEMVVGTVGVPAMVLLALAKIRMQGRAQEEER